MRVLHILEATSGGTRRHVLDLLPALQARGVRCDLVASPLRSAHFARDALELLADGIHVFTVDMARGFSPKADAQALLQLHNHLRRERYDLIHCHSTKAGCLGRLACIATPKTPLVYTPHCVAFDTGLPRLQRRAARYMETLLAPLTSHFIAVSSHEKQTLMRSGICKPNRVSTIYNGVDVTDFESRPEVRREDFGLQKSDFVIGCFGRLTRQKNQAVLLRALPRVLNNAPNARLLFVGGGEDETALRHLAQRVGVSERVLWLGEIADARPLYELCDVVAQPSLWEGCPYTILEAMTARRAIVSSDVGGVPELINSESGILINSLQPELWAQQLIELLSTQELRMPLGDAARARVERDFKLQQMVEKTLHVYRTI